ncbi:hypothetical protein [Ekhidna sp.]|uniref:hypothetical protein n=1 Tax=Ekhidna sp. TaxID=2608089 RepID=UPI003B5CBEA6
MKQEAIEIIEKPLLAPSPISQLLDSLRPQTSYFLIDSQKDTLLADTSGLAIAINANTFVNSSGELVKGDIKLEVVQALTYGDMIGSGLQTTSGGQILQTSGMIYINASSSGQPLAIKKGNSILVDLQESFPFRDAQIFMGTFDDQEKINWEAPSNLSSEFFSIPIELLEFNYGAWECWYNEDQIKYLKGDKFQNTYMSTREFEYRMNVFNMYSTCPQMNNLDDEIIDIYASNLERNLFYSDSLVAVHLLNNFGDKIDTAKRSDEFDFSDAMWLTYLYESALEFHKQKLTKPINFEIIGINDNTSVDQLIENGYSENEANYLLSLFEIRKNTIASRTAEQKVRELRSYTFSITELGWVNVDRFLDDPNAKESNFIVQANSRNSLDYISVQLIIPNYSIVLSAFKTNINEYSFTKKANGYRKLPINEDAILVALSMKDNIAVYGEKKIKIPSKGEISLELLPTEVEKIKMRLSEFGN